MAFLAIWIKPFRRVALADVVTLSTAGKTSFKVQGFLQRPVLPVIDGQMLFDKLAHGGERAKLHDTGDDERAMAASNPGA